MENCREMRLLQCGSGGTGTWYMYSTYSNPPLCFACELTKLPRKRVLSDLFHLSPWNSWAGRNNILFLSPLVIQSIFFLKWLCLDIFRGVSGKHLGNNMVISILRDWTDFQLSQSENGNGVKCSFLGELEFPSLLAASAVRCFALFFFCFVF